MAVSLGDLKGRRRTPLEVPEFGANVQVWVCGMTVRERDAYILACRAAGEDNTKVMAARNQLVAHCMVDEYGKQICSSPDQVLDLDGAGVERVAARAFEMSGFEVAGEKKA